MKNKFFTGFALAAVIGLTVSVFGQAYYSAEDIKTDVRKADKGLQITVTSDDPEIVKDIQENYRWYRDALRYEYGPRQRGASGWGDEYCGGPCHRGFGGGGYGRRGGWR